MIIKTCFFISHILYDIEELVKDIWIVLLVIKACLIFHIKWLSHIKSVKPNLIRINLLMPKITFTCSWLTFKLSINYINCLAVLFLTSNVIQQKQGLSCINIINIIILRIISLYRTIFLHTMVNISFRKIKVLFLSCNLPCLYHSKDHTSVNVVPAGLSTLSCCLNVPCRYIECAVFNKIVQVSLYNRHLHTLFLPFRIFIRCLFFFFAFIFAGMIV